MIKAKFLPYALTSSWEDLREILANARYTDEESRGIKITDCTKREIKSTFYERVVYTESIDDPINGMVNLERQTFFATHFIMYNNNIMLIINPSKRVSSLLTYLLAKTNFDLAINECKLNIMSVANIFRNAIEEFVITKMSYNQFNVTDNLKCSMAFSSSKDLQHEIKNINIELPKIPNKLSFSGLFLGKGIRGEINESGTIAISHPRYEVMLDKITSHQQDIFI